MLPKSMEVVASNSEDGWLENTFSRLNRLTQDVKGSSTPSKKQPSYKPVQEAVDEDSSFDEPPSHLGEPLMFVDVALGQDQKPVRISIYQDSDPAEVAERFITEQMVSREIYYEELVSMLTHAKDNADA